MVDVAVPATLEAVIEAAILSQLLSSEGIVCLCNSQISVSQCNGLSSINIQLTTTHWRGLLNNWEIPESRLTHHDKYGHHIIDEPLQILEYDTVWLVPLPTTLTGEQNIITSTILVATRQRELRWPQWP